MKSERNNPVEIYASNHAVSTAAGQMTEHIEKLSQAGLIGAEEAKHRVASIEEIRALTNADVGINMNTPELENARTAEQKKLAIERKWKKIAGDTEPKPTRKK